VEWKKFHKGAQLLQNLFGYLNKQMKKEQNMEGAQHVFLPVDPCPPQSKCVGNLAFDIWKAELIQPLSEQLINFIIDLITRDRQGEKVDDVINVRDVIASFVEVSNR